MSFDPTQLGILVFGLTAVFKQLGVPGKWLPLLATILGGMIAGALYKTLDPSVLLEGVMTGLVTTGLVSGASDILAKLKS